MSFGPFRGAGGGSPCGVGHKCRNFLHLFGIMARYEHLPICKAALDGGGFRKLVAGFPAITNTRWAMELRNGSRRVVEQVVRANGARAKGCPNCWLANASVAAADHAPGHGSGPSRASGPMPIWPSRWPRFAGRTRDWIKMKSGEMLWQACVARIAVLASNGERAKKHHRAPIRLAAQQGRHG